MGRHRQIDTVAKPLLERRHEALRKVGTVYAPEMGPPAAVARRREHRAQAVVTRRGGLRRVDREGYPARQGERMTLGGSAGSAGFEGPWCPSCGPFAWSRSRTSAGGGAFVLGKYRPGPGDYCASV